MNCLHILVKGFKNDGRVLKEITSLSRSNLFSEIRVVALGTGGPERVEKIDDTIRIRHLKLITKNMPQAPIFKALKYLNFMMAALAQAAHLQASVIHCHDLEALPIGVLTKLLWGGKLVYDAHELETERKKSVGRVRRVLTGLFEKTLLLPVDQMFTVSDSIADWYGRRYRIRKPDIIRNVPPAEKSPIPGSPFLKDLFHLSGDDLLFIYQGGFLEGRGIERLLGLFSRADKNKHIVFMGDGKLEGLVKTQARRFSNIHHLPSVPVQDVVRFVAGADVGIYLMENTCLNHFFSLPNKLFEYLLAGLPVIVSNMLEQSRLVKTYDCGWVADDKDQGVLDLINSLNRDGIAAKKAGVETVSKKFTWPGEEEKLLLAYRRLIRAE